MDEIWVVFPSSIDDQQSKFSFGRTQHFSKTFDLTIGYQPLPLATNLQDISKPTDPTINHQPSKISLGWRKWFMDSPDSIIDHLLVDVAWHVDVDVAWHVDTDMALMMMWHDTRMLTWHWHMDVDITQHVIILFPSSVIGNFSWMNWRPR
jgi:hypothetical protein